MSLNLFQFFFMQELLSLGLSFLPNLQNTIWSKLPNPSSPSRNPIAFASLFLAGMQILFSGSTKIINMASGNARRSFWSRHNNAGDVEGNPGSSGPPR